MNKVNKIDFYNSFPLYHKSFPLYRRRLKARRKNILAGESGIFTGKELDAETGLYYYGARYLDPRTSRWLSGDPALGEYIPGAPVDEEAKKRNGNLPGQGGVFNLVNLHVYHYAGNNPIKYTDPDGKSEEEPKSLKETWAAFLKGSNRDRNNIFNGVKNFFTTRKGFQAGLDKAGYVIDVADVVNAAIYAANGETDKAIVSGIGALGIIGSLKGGLKNIKNLENVLEGATIGRKTAGRTTQFVKNGGFEQALKDFEAMGATEVKKITKGSEMGFTGKLAEGDINVRSFSSEGHPTLEIINGNNRIKIRYDE
jgi:RHS repeat-associated protein